MVLIVDQLIEIYLKYENWHTTKLDKEEARKYFNKLIETGNILYHEEEGEVLGYVEVWKLNYEQWGRVVCHAPLSAYLEDVSKGHIAYVANVYIKPEHRRSKVAKILKMRFFKATINCRYFVGHALTKKSQPIKVLTRNAMLKKYGG